MKLLFIIVGIFLLCGLTSIVGWALLRVYGGWGGPFVIGDPMYRQDRDQPRNHNESNPQPQVARMRPDD